MFALGTTRYDDRVQKPEVTRSKICEPTTVHQRHIRDPQDLATQSSRSFVAFLLAC